MLTPLIDILLVCAAIPGIKENKPGALGRFKAIIMETSTRL